MWKNKHIVIALLVAPVLALIAYFAVDYMVAERPHAAVAGADYPLLAKPNCRYASGRCELQNGDVKLALSVTERDGRDVLSLDSALPLADARVALATTQDDDPAPVRLAPEGRDGRRWHAELTGGLDPEQSLRLVVVAGESRYYAEVTTAFFESEPSPGR